MSYFVDEKREKAKPVSLWAMADRKDKIILTFLPVRISNEENWNPKWEDWNCYKTPLIIRLSDYDLLLKSYFDSIFPTKDAFDGTPMESLDVCFDNWIGSQDWRNILDKIKEDLENHNQESQKFLSDFVDWGEEALEKTTIIVVEGNL